MWERCRRPRLSGCIGMRRAGHTAGQPTQVRFLVIPCSPNSAWSGRSDQEVVSNTKALTDVGDDKDKGVPAVTSNINPVSVLIESDN